MKQILSILLLFSLTVQAQSSDTSQYVPDIKNGPWIQENVLTKRLIPYPHVAQRDVLWSKRVWRAIDLREKINQPLYYPLDDVTSYEWSRNAQRWSLWTIIRAHIMKGDLRVFSPYNPLSYGLGEWDGDQLKYPIESAVNGNYYSDVNLRNDLVYYLGRLGAEGTDPLLGENGEPLTTIDSLGNPTFVYAPPDTIWYNSDDIIEYRLKEDCFFDKQRSEMDVRIIAIAPVVYDIVIGPDGTEEIQGKKELFWLYFPECRYVFNNYYTYNSHNDTQWMSFDDLFWKRRFSSYIYKESNMADRSIDSYVHGVEALQESDRITDEMRNFEHDLWSY